MHLVCLLDEIANDLGLDDKKLSQALGFDRRTVARLREDEENWRLSKIQLAKLWRFAAEHGFQGGPFELRAHALWESFRDQPTVIFRSSCEVDAGVEQQLQQFLRHLDSECEVRVDEADVGAVEAAMRSKNTVFVGSPKANPASEIALALLYGIQPFGAGQPGNGVIPVRFLGTQPAHREGKSSFLIADDACGLEVRVPSNEKCLKVAVDWIPDSEFRSFAGDGVDAGIAVACTQPLGTDEPVRTILLAGYTGLATQALAQELTLGEPAIYEADLREPGRVLLAVLAFRFHKRRARSKRPRAELRRVLEDTIQWGPPWQKLERGI